MQDQESEWFAGRSAGVLLHLSSLPSMYGVGNLGESAHRWIDFLSDSGFKFWQMCPVGPTGYGDSPYQVFSSSAGNPYFIDWSDLLACGYIQNTDLHSLGNLPHHKVDYGSLFTLHDRLLRLAHANFLNNPKALEDLYGPVCLFRDKQSDWLQSYTAYQRLKTKNNHEPWWLWPAPDRVSSSSFIESLNQSDDNLASFYHFQQFLFRKQWGKIKFYAEKKGISLIGDLPIYVAPDSADSWSRPDLFESDENHQFKAVAGVPPDYFNEDGQYWGNPLYKWKAHAKENYSWWKQRISHQLNLFDIIRIDHFRAFHDYWSIPAGSPNGKSGSWLPGPGQEFWSQMKAEFPQMPFLAEDLGEINEDVRSLRKKVGLPGMAVLQFAFGSDSENLYLPHNLSPDLVLYTGTHDNDTALGWYESANEQTKSNFRKYFNIPGHDTGWEMMRQAYRTVSPLVILQAQDLLSLGTEARFNRPGFEQGNWQWRMTYDAFEKLRSESSDYLRDQALITGRLSE